MKYLVRVRPSLTPEKLRVGSRGLFVNVDGMLISRVVTNEVTWDIPSDDFVALDYDRSDGMYMFVIESDLDGHRKIMRMIPDCLYIIDIVEIDGEE